MTVPRCAILYVPLFVGSAINFTKIINHVKFPPIHDFAIIIVPYPLHIINRTRGGRNVSCSPLLLLSLSGGGGGGSILFGRPLMITTTMMMRMCRIVYSTCLSTHNKPPMSTICCNESKFNILTRYTCYSYSILVCS